MEEERRLNFKMWHKVLETLLIQQGLQGIRESAILKHFNDVHEDEVRGYLELLLKEDRVQKFKYSRHIYWRGTVEILNQEYRKEG